MHPNSLNFAGRAGAFLVCALFVFEGLHTTASAQWLPDRLYTAGPGIRVGNLELHPGVAARGGYDTNVFRSDRNEVGSAIIAVTPHLNISTLGRQRLNQGEDAAGSGQLKRPIAFGLGFATTFFHMFAKNSPTNVEFDTDANLAVLPDSAVGFDVVAAYQRNIRPFTEYTGRDANNEYARNTIAPGLRLRAQSRSGVLRTYVGYQPRVSIYESQTFNYLNSITHSIQAGSSWKFLPHTALISDAAFEMLDFFDPNQENAVVLLSDNVLFNARLGVNGNITRRINLRLLAGYAYINNDAAFLEDTENVIGEAILGYSVGESSFRVGYQRTVLPSAIGAWIQTDAAVLRVSTLLRQTFMIALQGSAGKSRYGRMVGPPNAAGVAEPLGFDQDTNALTTEREDIRLDGALNLEYRATNWLAIMADFSALATLTDFAYRIDTNRSTQNTVPPDPAEFVAFQAFGGVRLHY